MLKLVTISRISKEKGFERMLKFERLLASSGHPFIWDCYGDTSTEYAKRVIPKFKHIKFKGVTEEPKQVMAQYDYLVQLSDTEGFPYSIYEAMQQMVPVIATDFPSIHEMIQDGVNGYILDMNLNNFNAKRILTIPVISSFEEKSNEQDWITLLNMEPKKADKRKKFEVVVTKTYQDLVLGKRMKPGTKFKVSADRLAELEAAEVAKEVKTN